MTSPFALLVWLLAAAAAAQAYQTGGQLAPVIDNARVSVWDVRWDAPARPTVQPAGDAIVVSLAPVAGHVVFSPKGRRLAAPEHGRSVVIGLKDAPAPPLANTSGYPNAFPRPGVKKLFENDRVIVWDYSWAKGRPTPMHFHDKDVVVLYLENGALRSTTPGGQQTLNQYTAGAIRFNLRDRAHTEELASGTQRAIITELK